MHEILATSIVIKTREYHIEMIETIVTTTRGHYVWGTRQREEHAMNSSSGGICEHQ